MRITPPHLQPVLSRVKRFVERQPEGATLTHLTHKVAAYSGLNRKDKETLIEIIRESGMLCVIDDGRSTTLHHPKYGHKSVAPVMTPPQPTMECKMNKQLDPLKLEILQAYGMASRKFDEFVDAMAEVGKAVQKLKDLTV